MVSNEIRRFVGKAELLPVLGGDDQTAVNRHYGAVARLEQEIAKLKKKSGRGQARMRLTGAEWRHPSFMPAP